MQMSSVGLSKEGVALAPMCYTSYRYNADGKHSWCEKDVRLKLKKKKEIIDKTSVSLGAL